MYRLRTTPIALAALCASTLFAACSSGGGAPDSTGDGLQPTPQPPRSPIALAPVALSASGATPTLPHPDDSPIDGGPVGKLIYHGGPLMTGTVNIYYIFYGAWSAAAPTTYPILTDFAKSVGGSPYMSILGTYKDGNGTPAATQAHYAGGFVDQSYSQGTVLSNTSIVNIVRNNVGANPDPNGVYFVVVGPDINFSDHSFPTPFQPLGDYCVNLCGYHYSTTINGVDVKYAFIGNPNICPASPPAATQCFTVLPAHSPNADPTADTMVDDIAHELEESITDPDTTGYYSVGGWECGDACAYIYGPTWTPSGTTALANVYLSGAGATGRSYLLQENYVNLGSGVCSMIPPAAPPCQVLVGCGTEGVTLYCEGRASGDVAFQRNGVTVATIPLATTVATANYSVTDQPSGSGTVSYRACTSDFQGGQLCTAPKSVVLPLASCGGSGSSSGGGTHNCPAGQMWCGTHCAKLCTVQ